MHNRMVKLTQTHWRKLLILLMLALALATGIERLPALAQEQELTVVGTIANGTAGGGVPADVAVTLEVQPTDGATRAPSSSGRPWCSSRASRAGWSGSRRCGLPVPSRRSWTKRRTITP